MRNGSAAGASRAMVTSGCIPPYWQLWVKTIERNPARTSVVQTVSATRIQSLNGRVAPTGGPGNGANTTPKSIDDLLYSLDPRCPARLHRERKCDARC